MINKKKLLKIQNFIGSPTFEGSPLFLNSMPKAGTNLFEQFLIELGYRRNISRCLNETNIVNKKLHPAQGKFYIGHLFDDSIIDSCNFKKIFIKRDLWACLRSYVNYMFIDTKHPVSHFIRTSKDLSAIHNLFFTNENPNCRPLIDEYIRFYHLDFSSYSLVIDYDKFIGFDTEIINELAISFEISADEIANVMRKACDSDSSTKNIGLVDLFKQYDSQSVQQLKNRVNAINHPF